MRFGPHGIAFASGLVFALGLGISGMTQPSKVLGFLDISGAWEPALGFVMASAVLVYALLYRLAVRRHQPVFGGALQVPTRRDIDARLVGGAAVFGVGWGLSGFCPGPALTSLASGNGAVLVFVLAMSAGMLAHGAVARSRGNAPLPGAPGHA